MTEAPAAIPSPRLRWGGPGWEAVPLGVAADERRRAQPFAPPPLAPPHRKRGEGDRARLWEVPVPSRDRSDPRKPRARRLRRDSTPFERKLWVALRLVELPDGHFRRQVPIGPYFADFADHGLKLVVELDGDQHGQEAGRRRDMVRTAFLQSQGYRVLRFWNHEITENLDGIVETILADIAGHIPC